VIDIGRHNIPKAVICRNPLAARERLHRCERVKMRANKFIAARVNPPVKLPIAWFGAAVCAARLR